MVISSSSSSSQNTPPPQKKPPAPNDQKTQKSRAWTWRSFEISGENGYIKYVAWFIRIQYSCKKAKIRQCNVKNICTRLKRSWTNYFASRVSITVAEKKRLWR